MLGQARKPRVARKAARTTKGWRKDAPSRRWMKARLYKACGPGAFLKPNRSNPKLSKYPVMKKCPKRGRCGCVYDCRGLRAAASRSGQYKHWAVQQRAYALGRKLGCRWAV